MPNWCECILIVKGPTEVLDRFFAENQDVPAKRSGEEKNPDDKPSLLSFEKALPTPKEFVGKTVGATEMAEMFGAAEPTSWYTWHVKYWGTKWDANVYRAYRGMKPDRLIYIFDTAWSPPSAWTKAASEKYPILELELRYAEGGCDFSGARKFKAGHLLESKDANYKSLRYPDTKKLKEHKVTV